VIRLLPLLLAVSLLAACSSVPKIDKDLKPQLWLEHQIAINGITAWNINGRLAVKNEKDSGTATLLWEQSFANYELRVIAPLGQGTYILKGTSDGVVMQDPKNISTKAETAEQLLYEALGWKIHINGLKYWVRGIPEPYMIYSELLLDEKGRLTNMKQSGFDVSVLRYTEQNGISLPEKLTIKSNDIQLKLVIKDWKT
jgi:outer membrane lipoprotein LolB